MRGNVSKWWSRQPPPLREKSQAAVSTFGEGKRKKGRRNGKLCSLWALYKVIGMLARVWLKCCSAPSACWFISLRHLPCSELIQTATVISCTFQEQSKNIWVKFSLRLYWCIFNPHRGICCRQSKENRSKKHIWTKDSSTWEPGWYCYHIRDILDMISVMSLSLRKWFY